MPKVWNIVNFKTIDSTNNYAKNNLPALPDHTVIVAERQSAGRGQQARRWYSASTENIYISIVLKPPGALTARLDRIGLTTAEIISRTVNQYLAKSGKTAIIKLPNDVLVDNRKIAGILVENRFRADRLLGSIIGIGINLNQKKSALAEIDQPATALNLLLNRKISKNIFLNKLLTDFELTYQAILKA